VFLFSLSLVQRIVELKNFVELFFLPQEDCSRNQDWVGDQVLAALSLPLVVLSLPPFPVAILLPFSQAFGSPVVLTVSPIELFVPLVGLILGPIALPFLSM